MTTEQTILPASRNWKNSFSRLCSVLSGLLLILLIVSFSTRWDILNLPTVVPLFLWLGLGLLISVLVRHSTRIRYLLVLGWFLSAFILGDSPMNFLRTLMPVSERWEAIRKEGRGIRVVSINCQSLIGSIEELESLAPDIILIQESPAARSIAELIERRFPGWNFVWSPDAAMMVRGKATPYSVPNELKSQYVFAAVELQSGFTLDVVSTRLVPVPLRFDIWNPGAWTSYSQNRQRRRTQLTKIHEQIRMPTQQSRTADMPLIFGGDFNAPAQDDIFRVLKPELRDAWHEAGRGWGKTIINSFPVQRIDAIWISSHFSGASVTAKKSEHSDHRMVISDLRIE